MRTDTIIMFCVLGGLFASCWILPVVSSWYANMHGLHPLRPEERPQNPDEQKRAAIGPNPTPEAERKYMRSHLYFRQPYCVKRDVAHCKDCICHRESSTGLVYDCHGRAPIECPVPSPCSRCKHSRKHTNDPFYDCEGGPPLQCDWMDNPLGRYDVYVGLCNKWANYCLYFERTDDPVKIADAERNEAEHRRCRAIIEQEWEDTLRKYAMKGTTRK